MMRRQDHAVAAGRLLEVAIRTPDFRHLDRITDTRMIPLRDILRQVPRRLDVQTAVVMILMGPPKHHPMAQCTMIV